MDYLGDVETITNDGKIIVRAKIAPSANNAVFDSRERKVGTVKRVFGPVDSPYVTIVPADKGKMNDLLNKPIYFKGENNNGKGKRRS